MQIIVKSHHVEITDALKEYAEKRMVKLEHFFDHIIKITINLNIESSSAANDRQVASAIVICNGSTITGKEATADMYSSIDGLLDKLAIQLKKHKEKLKAHKGLGSTTPKPVVKESRVKEGNTQTEYYIPKPMDTEDAVQIMEDEKLNILVFRDLTESVGVLYKDPEGDRKLIRT